MPVADSATKWTEELFTSSIIPTLVEYIKIPNKSAMFDPEWREHGYMDKATELLAGWARTQLPGGATLEVVRLGERTPVIFMDIPATGGRDGDTVMLYGHLDKQPEMTGWREGFGPWTPVLEGDKLYGRGGADDGYAIFASLTAINALRRDKLPHARCIVLIEACEESGSFDLPAYIEHLAPRIGQLSLVVCLDSGCANYDQLWSTTSLRGNVVGNLDVSLLTEGVHSGDATGVIAASERIIRQLLERIEDCHTGQIKLAELATEIPRQRILQAERTAQVIGDEIYNKFPLQPGVVPISNNNVELILNRTWRPTLAIIGADGWPPVGSAGNVLRPFTRLKLSVRIPAHIDPDAAAAALKQALEKDPPYGAKVSFSDINASAGWDSPEMAPWLDKALDAASRRHFGKPSMYMGEGGTIPFMAMLGEKFPKAQFCITGVLGPSSNAHGPNEFLHLPTARKLTLCIADVLAEHAKQ
jgi:acetylornithine deacetylase/succinyl-diaminopimelate desuccinylase-like protein